VELGYDRFLRLRHIGARAGRGFFVGDVPPGVPGHAGCGHCATNRRGQQPFLFRQPVPSLKPLHRSRSIQPSRSFQACAPSAFAYRVQQVCGSGTAERLPSLLLEVTMATSTKATRADSLWRTDGCWETSSASPCRTQ
jgi:hypothetical protein